MAGLNKTLMLLHFLLCRLAAVESNDLITIQRYNVARRMRDAAHRVAAVEKEVEQRFLSPRTAVTWHNYRDLGLQLLGGGAGRPWRSGSHAALLLAIRSSLLRMKAFLRLAGHHGEVDPSLEKEAEQSLEAALVALQSLWRLLTRTSMPTATTPPPDAILRRPWDRPLTQAYRHIRYFIGCRRIAISLRGFANNVWKAQKESKENEKTAKKDENDEVHKKEKEEKIKIKMERNEKRREKDVEKLKREPKGEKCRNKTEEKVSSAVTVNLKKNPRYSLVVALIIWSILLISVV